MLLVFLLYGRTVTFDFLHYDDNVLVAENPRLHPYRFENLVSFWTDGRDGIYMPATYSLWLGLAQAAAPAAPEGRRFAPWVFHLANVLLFLACTLLAYRILLQLAGRPAAALAGAAVFAAHPAQAEAVAWISEAKGLLAWTLGFLALSLFIAACQNDNPNEPAARRPLVLASAAYLAALFAKPSAVAVPVMAAVLAGTVLPQRSLRRTAPLLVLWCLAAAAFAALASRVQGGFLLETPSWPQRFAVAAEAALWYARLLLVPFIPGAPDSGRHPFRLDAGPGLMGAAGPFVVVAAGVCVLAFLRSSRRFNLAAAGVALAGVLPVLGWVPFAFQEISIVADRHLLPSLLGLGLAVAASTATRPGWARSLAVGAFCALVVFGPLERTSHWRDDRALADHALRVHPDSRLFLTQRAVLRLKSGDASGAVADAERAASFDPPFLPACQNLAIAQYRSGRAEEAFAALERGLARSPKDANLLSTKAEILAAERQYGRAAETLETLLATHPEARTARLRLGAMKILAGDEAGGLATLRELLGTPRDALQEQLLVAQIWREAGEDAEAVRRWQAILNAWGAVPAAKLQLAWILATTPDERVRDPHRAERLAGQTLRLLRAPSPQALDALAAALAGQGRFNEAVEAARKAHKLALERNDAPLAADIQARIELYRRGEPYREKRWSDRAGLNP
jgi:tetratricopeptide (TPR) repeat protein